MFKYVFLLLFVGLLFSCKDQNTSKVNDQTASGISTIDYPEGMDKVFENHGSLDRWRAMKAMSYDIVKEEGNETQMIDLKTRAERIKASNFESGFDGEKYWVVADTSYKGNPKFYTNLMFYFYAMPFVLADSGIQYKEMEPLVFEEKEYPGYRISYNSDVGVSPEDEYFIHYDPQTYEMAWLGYTVTFYTGAKSEKIKWIRYNDWKQINGLKLPNSLSWYKTEEGKITELRNTREFANISVKEQAFPAGKLEMPSGAKIVE